MRKILLVSLLLSSVSFSQAPVIEWQKSLGGSSNDWAYAVQQTTDGGYIVAGDSDSNDGDVTGNHGGNDFWVVRLNVSGNIIWQKTFGGSGIDIATSIQQTTDGGYIVGGVTSSSDGDVTVNLGGNDFWIVKLDVSGDIIWQKSLGGSGNDVATSIQQTTDGGYIVAGNSDSNDGDISENKGLQDSWVVKLDALGSIVWEQSLGGSEDDRATSIQQTSDGGYIFCGLSESNDGNVTVNNGGADSWLVKLDFFGNITWEYSLGGSELDQLGSVQQTMDGGYIFAGNSFSSDGDLTVNNGGGDFWIIKLNATGDLSWQKSLGGSLTELGFSIQQTSDGGYIVAGYSSSSDGNVSGNNGLKDFWLVKLDAFGNLSWQKSLGGSLNDLALSIQQTTDEGFIVVGETYSNNGDVSGNNGNSDFWVVKLGPSSLVDELNDLMVDAYPNPTSGEVNLSIGTELIGKDFSIFDFTGREVVIDTFKSQNFKVDLSSCENGIYFLKIDKKHKSIKLVKQ